MNEARLGIPRWPLLCEDDTFGDRRLSDLLPSEFISSIGLDPNQYANDKRPRVITRRCTDPDPVSAKAMILVSKDGKILRAKTRDPVTATGHNIMYFEVELNDVTVNCFAYHDSPTVASAGVVVTDGLCLRYGIITRQITKEECGPSSHQIIAFDRDGALGDLVSGQCQIASALAAGFITGTKMNCRLQEVETVSWERRSLMKIRVSNIDAEGIEDLARHMINIFAIPVQIYE
jgi:hypothetical protein